MILYHGTNIDIQSINLALCRPYKDFGKGFYTTEIFEQAQKMAKRVARIYGGNPIADDDMTMLFRQYQNSLITLQTMVNGMTFRNTTSQYSFHTERAVSLLKKEGVLQ